MKYLVIRKGIDDSIKNKPRSFKVYFQGMMFGMSRFGYDKKDAKIFNTKKDANRIAKLRKNYEIEPA